MKIQIPAFEAMAKCNEHLNHGPIDIDLGDDVVVVVRCRECVNCLIDNTERKYHLCMRHSSVFPRKVDLMDFCSYGERKEGADNG